jgi:hypothetical protein
MMKDVILLFRGRRRDTITEQLDDRDQRVWEGTWEELATRGDQFAGRRFRLTSLEDGTNGTNGSASPPGETLDKVLAPLLEEARLLRRDANAPVHTDPAEIAFGEIMQEKARKLGFEL